MFPRPNRPRDTARTVPDLEPGLAFLSRPGRGSKALHRVAIAAIGEADGVAYWIDAGNDASSYTLFDLAPHRRLLEPLYVARAFTAYQHHELVRRLARTVDPRTAVIVAPSLTTLYRDDDIPAPEDRDYLEASLTILQDLAGTFDLPVLVSVPESNEFTELVAEYAQREITAEATDFGPRFEADGFQTTLYWHRQGWQTTIPYWVELVEPVEERVAVPTAFDLGLAGTDATANDDADTGANA